MHVQTIQQTLQYIPSLTWNYSCETALIKLVNIALWSMERKKVTMLITIDLLAAFDMVDNDILISVLQTKFGVKGKH